MQKTIRYSNSPLAQTTPTPLALSNTRTSTVVDDGDHSASTFLPHDVQDNHIECPPDGGYGWICVACCFAVNCFTWGVVSVSLPMIATMAATRNSSHLSLMGYF